MVDGILPLNDNLRNRDECISLSQQILNNSGQRFGGMFGCIIVMLIIPILGAIAILGCAIGTVVVGILKLVYLYRTAKIFREYPLGV